MTIIEIRGVAGLSQAEFGERYGISERLIEKWESGETNCPGYIINLLERMVVQGEEDPMLRYDDSGILKEIGACCKELLRVINKDLYNPYPQAKIFPTKYFTKIYLRALRVGIPDDLDERIMLLMNSVYGNDWTDSMKIPLTKRKQAYFIMGFYG